MTHPQYTASANFGKDKEIVNSFIFWYEGATRKQRSIFKVIWGFARACNYVYPSQKKHIAEKTLCSREYINRMINKMIGWGFLASKRRAYHSNLYFVHEALIKLDINHPKLFSKNHVEFVNICEPCKQPNPQGKGHTMDHKRDHHYFTEELRSNLGNKTENVGVRSSLFVHNSEEELRKRKDAISACYSFAPGDRKSFMRFSSAVLERSATALHDYSRICLVHNWAAAYETQCQVYQLCEQMGIEPKHAWEIYKQRKNTKQARK